MIVITATDDEANMDGLISLVKAFEDSVSQKPLGPDCGPPIIHCTYVSFPVRFVIF